MGGSQRIAIVAAGSHAKHYYNNTHTGNTQADSNAYTCNVFFISITLCGVLVAVCAACWRRTPRQDKPEELRPGGVYTISTDCRLNQVQMEPGPPPAYETLIDEPTEQKDSLLQEVVSEPCPRCLTPEPTDELPTYEAAVMLKDTKL